MGKFSYTFLFILHSFFLLASFPVLSLIIFSFSRISYFPSFPFFQFLLFFLIFSFQMCVFSYLPFPSFQIISHSFFILITFPTFHISAISFLSFFSSFFYTFFSFSSFLFFISFFSSFAFSSWRLFVYYAFSYHQFFPFILFFKLSPPIAPFLLLSLSPSLSTMPSFSVPFFHFYPFSRFPVLSSHHSIPPPLHFFLFYYASSFHHFFTLILFSTVLSTLGSIPHFDPSARE